MHSIAPPLTALPLATRGVGEVALAQSFPDAVVAVFWALTHLGNPYLLLSLVALAYLLGERVGLPRRSAAFALALGLCAIGITIGLKHFFALPRPPISYRGGYGFPSGHALGSTAFWGGVAVLATRGRWRRRLGIAGAVVAVVALSRVAIGVHYLADVAAGVGVGVAFLALVFALGPGFEPSSPTGALATPDDRHVTAVFGIALLLGLVGLTVAPGESELLLAVGTALGGTLSWYRFGPRAAAAALDPSPRSLAVGIGGLAAALAVMSGAAELSANARVVVAAGAVGAVALLALPLLVGDVDA